jgi:hypothetical protein
MRVHALHTYVGCVQWRSKNMANCAFAGGEGGIAKECKIVQKSYFHPTIKSNIFPLYFSKYVDVVYLYTLRVNLVMKLWK